MASAKDNMWGLVLSREDEDSERDAEAFGMNMCLSRHTATNACPSTLASNTEQIPAVHVTTKNVRFQYCETKIQ